MSRGPFGRHDAKTRAQILREEAEHWDGVVAERQTFVALYEGEDKVAAQAHVDIGRRRADFCRELAEAYDRAARGEPPFPPPPATKSAARRRAEPTNSQPDSKGKGAG